MAPTCKVSVKYEYELPLATFRIVTVNLISSGVLVGVILGGTGISMVGGIVGEGIAAVGGTEVGWMAMSGSVEDSIAVGGRLVGGKIAGNTSGNIWIAAIVTPEQHANRAAVITPMAAHAAGVSFCCLGGIYYSSHITIILVLPQNRAAICVNVLKLITLVI